MCKRKEIKYRECVYISILIAITNTEFKCQITSSNRFIQCQKSRLKCCVYKREKARELK